MVLIDWAEVSELDLVYRLRQMSTGSPPFLSITIFYFVLLQFYKIYAWLVDNCHTLSHKNQ